MTRLYTDADIRAAGAAAAAGQVLTEAQIEKVCAILAPVRDHLFAPEPEDATIQAEAA